MQSKECSGLHFVLAKATDRATEFEEVDRAADGVGWIAHPEETM